MRRITASSPTGAHEHHHGLAVASSAVLPLSSLPHVCVVRAADSTAIASPRSDAGGTDDVVAPTTPRRQRRPIFTRCSVSVPTYADHGRARCVSNTTAAIGKGFAIGSAALTALALFSAYATAVGLGDRGLDLLNPMVVIGLFIGGVMPFFIGASTMTAVGRAAQGMVAEVRRQFREIPGLMEGTAQPDSARCVDISTRAALREMMIPGLSA